MKKICVLLAFLISVAVAGLAAERSFTIRFGAPAASTTSLTNGNFTSAVSAGADYIDQVTSVVAVFPEKDAIRLSSQKTNGKFNIRLTEAASVVATRIELEAARYDNDRDMEAALMVNSETLLIPSTETGFYTLHIPSRPEKTLTNIIVDADHRVYLSAITVYYDDSKGDVEPVLETVATPVFTPAGGTVSAGTNAEITCATPGATIYYTVDGTEPTSAAIAYDAPVALHHDITLRAFAVAPDMKPSAISSASFTVRNPQATLESVFNFADPATLTPALEAPATKEWIELDGRTFADGDVAVTFTAAAEGNTHARLYASYDAGIDLRLYNGDIMTLRSLNPSMAIDAVEVTISTSGADADAWFVPSEGEWIWERNCWEPSADVPATGELELVSWQQSRITSMRVHMVQTASAPPPGADSDASRTRWYNIQGLPVANPAPGLNIRLRPDGAEKIIVR